MNCQQFLDALTDLLDGDLDAGLTAIALRHAGECAGCGAVLASSRQMLGWMGDRQNFALPPAASVRLRAKLEQHLNPAPERASDPTAHGRWAWLWLRPRWAAALVLIVLVVGLARWRADATTTSGWLIDQNCAVSFRSHPGDHTLSCLRRCAAKGMVLGLLDTQGRFRRFDAQGEQTARAALAATHRADHMWVTVKARASGHGVLDVEQLALTEPPGSQ